MTYSGRVEAKITVPTGGAAVSASNGAVSSAVTVTVPAGSYYHTAAGGVSSLLTTLQDQLNQNGPQGYPLSAAAMQSAVGYGTWSAGWLFNITSGNDTGAFGGVTMTAVSSPTYSIAGPAAGIDLAVGFDASTDGFDAGANFDVSATDDLIVAWVGKFTSVAAGSVDLFGKWGAAGYLIYRNASTLTMSMLDGVDNPSATATITSSSEWTVGMLVVNRATNMARVGLRTLSGTESIGAEVDITALGTMSNAATFEMGNILFGMDTGFQCSAMYIGKGSAVGDGLSANLSTALQRFANSINAAWSVSMSTTTGLVTISNSFWPSSVSYTSTALRDVLGNEYDFDYPQTSAAMAAITGYGSWSVGYLFNESSGNPASLFGTPASLTATTLTYSNLGARGGSDKAIGFSAGTSSADGGDTLDVSATSDLCICWVGKFNSASGNADVVAKSGAAIWLVYRSAGSIVFTVNDGVGSVDATAASVAEDHWHVGMAVLDRSTNQSRIAIHDLVTGTATVGTAASTAAIGSLENAASFVVGNALFGADTNLTMSALYVGTGVGAATGLSTNLSTALSNFATYMKSQTGTEQAEALWIPDCPLNIEGDPAQAPKVTDLRMTRGPTGNVLGLSGNAFYRHKGVMWTHVPRAQVWESEATYANASLEHFANAAFFGFGHAWLGPASPLQIYWNDAGTDRAVGYAFNSSAGVAGWSVLTLDSVEPKKSIEGWSGLFRVEFGEIVSSG